MLAIAITVAIVRSISAAAESSIAGKRVHAFILCMHAIVGFSGSSISAVCVDSGVLISTGAAISVYFESSMRARTIVCTELEAGVERQ